MRRTRAERHGLGRKRAKKTWNTPEEFLSSLRGEGFVSSRRGCVRWNTCRRLGHPNGQYRITISCFSEFFSSSVFTDPARLQLYQAILEAGTRSLHSYPQMRIRELSYPAISTRTVNPPVDCLL